MACDPNEGMFREIEREEDARPGEVVFKSGEQITVKGCLFEVINIYPNPENTLILKCHPLHSMG